MAGPDGVIPTRGQVMAIRAAAPLSEVTKVGWSGNEGFEYWFPRPLTHPSISDHSEGDDQRPVVILGGGREAMMPSYELYEADDSTVDKKVGEAMRKFLPAVFPGKYEIGREPEMEWTGIMGFTKTGDPFVGPVKFASGKTLEGQFISAGFSGHGMPRAFACAEVVAGMVVCDMRGETWAVPEWLPLHYLTTERK
ncbi:hypothetical protein EW026_g5490 [Hermanssonia centrifuga]|uniref:FAD dependent oxidoreductase domain-containing protein n=1 Tax=Hermanssonia centrifuga TaxID=98765 RepID=A0A4S4KDX4_9APHY|nr:hypothetical protein EW026_g5490 [Hermanssonia centrifuga]